MRPHARKHVLLLSPSALTFQGMAKYGGIQHYLRANRVRWDVRIGGDHYGHAHSKDSFMREFDYGVDGILLDDEADPRTLHRIIESRVPVVSMDWCAQFRQDGVRFANVSLDESVVGKRAAAYLTEDSAYESYAYVDFQPLANWSQDRLSAFQAALAERGYDCASILAFEGLERIRQLPKPLAILAANDWIANTVTQRCELMGLRVSEEVAVLGVDDEAAICDHANPPISSIQPDFHACGYKAAALMTALLAGRRVAPPVDVRHPRNPRTPVDRVPLLRRTADPAGGRDHPKEHPKAARLRRAGPPSARLAAASRPALPADPPHVSSAGRACGTAWGSPGPARRLILLDRRDRRKMRLQQPSQSREPLQGEVRHDDERIPPASALFSTLTGGDGSVLSCFSLFTLPVFSTTRTFVPGATAIWCQVARRTL